MKKLAFVFVLFFLIPLAAAAQGTAFNFQGRLNDGTNPANGRYDLQFGLFNAVQGGAQIGSTIARPNTILINGVFSVTLDFGAAAFNSPNSIFIEIGVKPANSPNAYTILGPRQQLTVVPFSVRASSATNADNATNAVNAQNATTAITANTLNGLVSTDFIRNTTSPQTNTNFNIVGNGFINGKLSVTGSTAQNRDQGGFVKAMVFVDIIPPAEPVIARCFNGLTGVSTGTCGFTVQSTYYGKYIIDFGFPVDDRFYAITVQQSAGINSGVNLTTGFFFPGGANRLGVKTNIADVTFPDSHIDSQFMLIVY